MQYLDYNGTEEILYTEDWLAEVLLHENKHLNSILYIDIVSKEMFTALLKR